MFRISCRVSSLGSRRIHSVPWLDTISMKWEMRGIDTGKTDEAEICDTHVSLTNSKPNQIQKEQFKLTCTTKYRGSHQCQVSPSNDQIPIIRRTLSTSISPQNVSTRSQPGFFGGRMWGWGTLRVSSRPFCVWWINVVLAQLIYSTLWWTCDLQLIRGNWWLLGGVKVIGEWM